MSKEVPKKVIDITGVELTPGEPDVCLGNGEQGYECCCDECDYYLLCFPEYDVKIGAENKDESPDALDRLISEAFKRYAFEKELEEFDALPDEEVKFSRRHKIRMNRIFRERVGGKFLPYPEVDNLFERIRSKIVIAHEARKEKKGAE
jgi:hypothetical protein